MLAPRAHLQHEERGSIQIVHHRHLLLHLVLWRLRAALREAASLPPSSPRGEHRLRCSPHTAQLVAEWPLLAKSRCTAFRGGRCAALALVVCPSASEPPGSVWRAVPTSIDQSIDQSINQTINRSINQSIDQSINQEKRQKKTRQEKLYIQTPDQPLSRPHIMYIYIYMSLAAAALHTLYGGSAMCNDN